MVQNTVWNNCKDESEHRSRIEDVIRAVDTVMALLNQANAFSAPTNQPSRDTGAPPTVPCAAEAMNQHASIGEGTVDQRATHQQEQLDVVLRSLGMDLGHMAPLPAVDEAIIIPSVSMEATCTDDFDMNWAAALSFEAISPMGHLDLPMPAASLLPSPPPQPPVGIPLAGPVPEPRWRKYAQKRVAGHGVPRAVLKQSYKCQHPDCTAVKVTCRDTVNDGPYGLQRLEFFGVHNHEVSVSLQAEMCCALSTFDPTYTGGRLKRKSHLISSM
jgi:hypothetical protein